MWESTFVKWNRRKSEQTSEQRPSKTRCRYMLTSRAGVRNKCSTHTHLRFGVICGYLWSMHICDGWLIEHDCTFPHQSHSQADWPGGACVGRTLNTQLGVPEYHCDSHQIHDPKLTDDQLLILPHYELEVTMSMGILSPNISGRVPFLQIQRVVGYYASHDLLLATLGTSCGWMSPGCIPAPLCLCVPCFLLAWLYPPGN